MEHGEIKRTDAGFEQDFAGFAAATETEQRWVVLRTGYKLRGLGSTWHLVVGETTACGFEAGERAADLEMPAGARRCRLCERHS